MAWTIDAAHSEINFTVRHMMISNVRGRFERFTGVVDFVEDNPAQSSLEVSIDAASISTLDPNRDGHLRSPDFLDAENYPNITFRGTRMEAIDRRHGRVTGDLTIRDVTLPVVLDVEYNGQARSPWGTVSAGFSAETTLKRSDWNLTWNAALETGGLLVGDDIRVHIEVELVKQTESVPEVEAVAA